MNLETLFINLETALCARNEILTEDNIRYYLFAKMYDQDNQLNHYILELPYKGEVDDTLRKCDFSGLNSKNNSFHQELDLFYKTSQEKIAIELKFHRRTMLAVTGLPNKAGELFNDLKRLELINLNGVRRIFVYVTDDEMHKYLSGGRRGIHNSALNEMLGKFYNGNPGNFVDFRCLNGAVNQERDGSETFFNCASKSFIRKFDFSNIGLKVRIIYKSDFTSQSTSINRQKSSGLHLRVYEIM